MFGFKLIRDDDLQQMREVMTHTQRTLEDVGWVNLNELLDAQQRLLVKGGRQQVIKNSRILYYHNPLAGHWVHLTTYFVFGEGVSKPKAIDPKIQEIVDEWWDDPDNKKSATSFQAQQLISNKLQYEGELFFIMFDDETGRVKIRLLNALEVKDIINDPDDRMRPNFYKVSLPSSKFDFQLDMSVANMNKTVYFADKDNILDVEKFNVPRGKFDPNARIFHVKINCDINDKFGVSELFRSSDWIRAHNNMAGDQATFIKSLAHFAWKKKVKGTQKQINSIQAAMSTKSDLSNTIKGTGATQLENESIDLQAIQTPTGGVKNMTDGLKNMVYMVGAGAGLPYHYISGDPSTGNLATAKSMELPVLKKFTTRQRLWEGIYDTLLQYAIDRKIEVGMLGGRVVRNTRDRRIEYETDTDRTIDIDFPPILEADLKEHSEAMEKALKNKLISKDSAARHFLSAANFNNIDEEIDKIEEDEANEPEPPTLPNNPFLQNPRGNGNRMVQQESERISEAIEKPAKNTGRAEDRLQRKSNFVEARMNAYRKAVNNSYTRLIKNIKDGIRVDKKKDMPATGIVENVDIIVGQFADEMKEHARKFFRVAVDIGENFVKAELRDLEVIQESEVKEVLGSANGVYERRIQWNNDFVDNSLKPAMIEGVNEAARQSYDTEDAFRAAVTKKVEGFEGRIGLYVGAFWTVEEEAVKEAGSGFGVHVNFIGPADDANCPGCDAAVNGGPYRMEEAPVPGEQDCLGRCRHALQIIEPGQKSGIT